MKLDIKQVAYTGGREGEKSWPLWCYPEKALAGIQIFIFWSKICIIEQFI